MSPSYFEHLLNGCMHFYNSAFGEDINSNSFNLKVVFIKRRAKMNLFSVIWYACFFFFFYQIMCSFSQPRLLDIKNLIIVIFLGVNFNFVIGPWCCGSH